MNFLRNLVIWRLMPERAQGWSLQRWTDWLSASSRIFFPAAEPAVRRRAFAPFSIEPVFSEVDFGDQLFEAVQQNAPDALQTFARAVLLVLAGWRPQDGHELALFLLKLVYRLGGFVGEKLLGALQRMVKDLGPPLAANQILVVLEEIVECAVGRLDVPDLRKLGTLIEGRGNWGAVRVWQAQSLLLNALVLKDEDTNIIANIIAVAPTLPDVVLRNSPAKRFLADTIVDRLDLEGVARLMRSKPASESESRILKILRYCIFPYRLMEESGSYKDRLYPEKPVYKLPPDTTAVASGFLLEQELYFFVVHQHQRYVRLFEGPDRAAA